MAAGGMSDGPGPSIAMPVTNSTPCIWQLHSAWQRAEAQHSAAQVGTSCCCGTDARAGTPPACIQTAHRMPRHQLAAHPAQGTSSSVPHLHFCRRQQLLLGRMRQVGHVAQAGGSVPLALLPPERRALTHLRAGTRYGSRGAIRCGWVAAIECSGVADASCSSAGAPCAWAAGRTGQLDRHCPSPDVWPSCQQPCTPTSHRPCNPCMDQHPPR